MYSARSRSRIAFEIPGTAHVATSLLRGRHRDALTTLGATATQDFASTTGLLARAKPVGALAALVVRLIGALHGWSSSSSRSTRSSRRRIDTRRLSRSQGGERAGFQNQHSAPKSATKFRRSLGSVLGLQPEIGI